MGSNPSKSTRTKRCHVRNSAQLKSFAEVAEWKTRLPQKEVSERACGFESHLRYKCSDVGTPVAMYGFDSRWCNIAASLVIAQLVEQPVEARCAKVRSLLMRLAL